MSRREVNRMAKDDRFARMNLQLDIEEGKGVELAEDEDAEDD